jgi:5-methylcytosine-specific restriction enzyme A
MRQEFTRKIKVAAWQRANGRCECCGRKLYPGDTHFDHANPDQLGGEPILENCSVLCRSCHQIKTFTKDIPAIAKSNRVRDRHAGIKPRRSRPIPGTRASGIRKRMSGAVELWPDRERY